MPDGLVRWPDCLATPGRVAVVTVSYNTRELTALLLWSLRRILAWESLEIVVVDNGSKDGSAELLGESWWDSWNKTDCFLAYSLLIDPVRVWRDGIEPFADGGDPAFDLLQSAKAQGETLSEFPFVRDRYVIHRGRSSLSAVWEAGDTAHPSYDWARDHHSPHFGLIDGAAARHDELMRAFRAEVGPLGHPRSAEALTIRP